MKAIVNGLAIDYLDDGRGEVVLMLHGWSARASAYDELAKSLVSDYRVVRLDLPGFGASETPPLEWGVDEFSELIVAFCDKLKLDVYGLVGHSFGGQLAVHLVGSGELKPKRLVLLAASAVRPSKTARDLAYNSVAKVGKRLVPPGRLATKLRAKLYGAAGTEDYLQSGEMQTIYRRIVGQDQLEYAEKISCPTVLIWGEKDDATPLKRAKLLNAAISGSKLQILPGLGHFAYLEAPDEVINLVREGLS